MLHMPKESLEFQFKFEFDVKESRYFDVCVFQRKTNNKLENFETG